MHTCHVLLRHTDGINFFFSVVYFFRILLNLFNFFSSSPYKNDQKNVDTFLQKSQVSSQSRVINSSHFSSFTSINGIIMQHYVMFLLMSCVCMRGIELFAGWGNDASFHWDPPFVPVSLFPGFVWTQSASRKLSH